MRNDVSMAQLSATPAAVPYAPDVSVPSALLERVLAQPNRVLIERRVAGAWQPVTATEFYRDVTDLARALVGWGVEPGDVVVIMGRTCYEWTLLDFAIWSVGGVPVPIYQTASPEQISWILQDSGAVLAFAETDELGAHLHEADAGSVREIVTFTTLADFRAAHGTVEASVVAQRTAALKADDLATVVYTSGTTGRPKGVEIVHGTFVYLSRNGARSTLGPVLNTDDARTLLFMPLAHVFARFLQVICLLDAGVLGHCADTRTLVADLQSFKPTYLLAVPRVFEKVYNSAAQKASHGVKKGIFHWATETTVAYSKAMETPRGPSGAQKAALALADRLVLGKLRAAMGGNLHYAVSGGAPLGQKLGHFFRGMGVTVLEGYGMTETCGPTTVNTIEKVKIGTVGPSYPGTQVRIASDGEIQVAGPHLFRGYRHDAEATAAAFTEDGWFHSQDLGSIDEDGYLTITGRIKDIIITASGKNVAPSTLEDALRGHPLVSQVVAVGDQKPYIGALITLDAEMLPGWLEAHGLPPMTVAEAAANPRVRSALVKATQRTNRLVSRAESIRRIRVLDVDFTEANGYLTPSTKVKRSLVRHDFAVPIEEIYTPGLPALDVPDAS